MKRHHLILIFILVISLFFRSYQAVERFEFAHDGDLYSWIVKDMVVNHHPRLIGQLTSAPGIFLGGLFYYLLIPFFLLSHMDPIGVILFSLIIGSTTTISYYFVFSKLFKVEVGLIAASLYAVLLTTVGSDRWIVPTITTNLWVIWYFYTILQMTRGNYQVLPLLGILIGLVWHIHIALIPALIAFPSAIILSKKLPSSKQTIQFLIYFFITSLPFFLSEAKHGFQQTRALITNFITPTVGPTGYYKFTLVLNMISKKINSLLFAPQSFKLTDSVFFVLLILLSATFLIYKKILLKKELIVFLVWILGVISFFGFSHSQISEYYFSNIEIIFLTIISLYLYLFMKSIKHGETIVLILLALIAVKNGYYLMNQDFYHKGYLEKKALVDYIKEDSKLKKYPCIGINYITVPGENVGFRYLFYLKKIHLIHPSSQIPVYNIVIPDELSKEETKKFGHIGIIPPTSVPTKEGIEKSCQSPNTNLSDSLFGYVD